MKGERSRHWTLNCAGACFAAILLRPPNTNGFGRIATAFLPQRNCVIINERRSALC
jgi:hypothetical protein